VKLREKAQLGTRNNRLTDCSDRLEVKLDKGLHICITRVAHSSKQVGMFCNIRNRLKAIALYVHPHNFILYRISM